MFEFTTDDWKRIFLFFKKTIKCISSCDREGNKVAFSGPFWASLSYPFLGLLGPPSPFDLGPPRSYSRYFHILLVSAFRVSSGSGSPWIGPCSFQFWFCWNENSAQGKTFTTRILTLKCWGRTCTNCWRWNKIDYCPKAIDLNLRDLPFGQTSSLHLV